METQKKGGYALVTGASSGIGLQYSRVLAREGYDLVMVSNEEAVSTKAAEVSKEFGVRAEAVVMDLGRQEAAGELYAWCRERNIEVEMLVNNAGVYHDRDFLDDSEGFNTLILMLHVYTPAMLTFHFGKDMAQRHKGYIINMSSVTSKFGIQRMSTYSSTKAFLQFFSRSVHIELRGKGVNVTCVRPGAVATTLYSLKPAAMKAGLIIGYIITPERLARKAVKAVKKGRAQITPGLYTKLLDFFVSLIPTCLLRLIRRWKIF
ncbi:MAG: SDR family NAD(P)-dependent oxidoreductase [Bacteroidales bacterium]|nr:SDR family NAD(P)-dependent oxidoreductase [Bacteroidales bacterium]